MKKKQLWQNYQPKTTKEKDQAQKEMISSLTQERNFWRTAAIVFAVLFVVALCL